MRWPSTWKACWAASRLRPCALFPQYRDVQELAGADRVHPADLWPIDWRWTEPDVPSPREALAYEPAVRSPD